MSETVKHYLLPSEIEVLLRRGSIVYSLNSDMTSRYTWSVKTGITREWRTLKIQEWRSEEHPNNAKQRKFAREDLSSWDCYSLVSVCECGLPLRLDGKCSVCDDYFG